MAQERGDIFAHSQSDDVTLSGYPDWLRKRLNWFEDQKFGLFIHWGIYCHWDCCESWPLVPEDDWARADSMKCWTDRNKDIKRFQRDYWALNKTFNPVNFNPDAWAAAAKYAGMKYVNFTTKHHDGFCMWDTETTDYRMTGPDCPFHNDPRSDITKEVFDAFRKKDFAISCYFSKSDWKSPHYWTPGRDALTRNPNYDTHAEPKLWQNFVNYTHRQIEELMTDYGPIDCLWLDGGQVRPPDQDIRMEKIAAMARHHQPGLIIVDRTVGGEFENVLTPERQIPDAPLGHPWESCLTMANDWCYTPGDTYKPAHELLRMLIETVAKGGNLLLGVGPKPDGTLTAEAMERLKTIGNWMQINSEAIHGTRAIHPYEDGNIRFTTKANKVYAIILPNPDQTQPDKHITITTILPPKDSKVFLLGNENSLKWHLTDNKANIILPNNITPQMQPAVLKYEIQ